MGPPAGAQTPTATQSIHRSCILVVILVWRADIVVAVVDGSPAFVVIHQEFLDARQIDVRQLVFVAHLPHPIGDNDPTRQSPGNKKILCYGIDAYLSLSFIFGCIAKSKKFSQ